MSTNEQPALLEVRGLTKTFTATPALSEVDFTLYPGEVHALLGENGAGKSTMIKIMTGVHQPSSGGLELDGKPVVLSGTQAARVAGIRAASVATSRTTTATLISVTRSKGATPKSSRDIAPRTARDRTRPVAQAMAVT